MWRSLLWVKELEKRLRNFEFTISLRLRGLTETASVSSTSYKSRFMYTNIHGHYSQWCQIDTPWLFWETICASVVLTTIRHISHVKKMSLFVIEGLCRLSWVRLAKEEPQPEHESKANFWETTFLVTTAVTVEAVPVWSSLSCSDCIIYDYSTSHWLTSG